MALEELLGEFRMFDEVFEDMEDVSGLIVLDIGTGGGSMVSYLVKKIRLERVFAIDLFTGTLGHLKEKLSSEELLKVILIKADLRRLDFLKDCFFDLVMAYWTLTVVEKFTPEGTENVLNEVYRILKPKGSLVIIEHWPTASIKPADEAQKVGAKFLNFSFKLAKALGEPGGIEYTPQSLMKTVENCGFKISDWKELKTTYLDAKPGETEFLSYTTKRIQKVSDEKLKEELLQEIMQIKNGLKQYGMRNIPNYVVYATKPHHPIRRKAKIPALKDLYDTIRHKDTLGY